MKPTQGSAIIVRSATSSSTEPMKRTPSSQCRCSAISRQTNFQPPRWCCHGVRFPAFSFLAGVKGPRVTMNKACACGSPCARSPQGPVDKPVLFRRRACRILRGQDRIVSERALRNLTISGACCLDILEKIGKVLRARCSGSNRNAVQSNDPSHSAETARTRHRAQTPSRSWYSSHPSTLSRTRTILSLYNRST